MSRTPLAALVVTAALLAAAPMRAHADPVLSSFTFAGVCSDCTGTATGTLVLQDYTLGQSIGDMNFVSFTYNGTNLFGSYVVTSSDLPFLFGSIDPTLPMAETVRISDSDIDFSTDGGGFWCTGTAFSCSLDNGVSHTWSLVGATTPANPVPEPMTLGLLGGGLLGLAALRRRT